MNISVNRRSNQSLSDQIVEAIQDGIDTNWYKEGDKLPSIRGLSKELSVSPMTVVSAYETLEKHGSVEKIHGKGIFVKKKKNYRMLLQPAERKCDESIYVWQNQIRDYVTRSRYAHRLVLFEDEVINLSTAALHTRFLPTDKILDQFGKERESFRQSFGRYPPVEGDLMFRKELKTYFSQKNIFCNEDQLLVTSGSQLGIHLVAETFIGQGDVVVVGAPTFPGAIDVFKNRGAIIIEVPIDDDGMHMDNLMAVCEQYPVKLVYVMATFQNPTGVNLSLDRCVELLALAKEYNFIVLEDDSWSDLSLDGAMRPLKVFDKEGRVIYLGGFSKVFGPSFRLSVIIAEGNFYTRLVAAKSNVDSGAPLMNQLMLSPYINSIDHKQHHIWLCHELKGLRDRVMRQMKLSMPSYVRFNSPKGGLVIWLSLPSRFDGQLLYYRCMTEENISILLGTNCYSSIKGENQLRICYTYEEEINVIESIKKIGHLIADVYEKDKRTGSRPLI